MKRKAVEVTMRSGLFSKGKDFYKKFGAEIGIVVLSKAGRPYRSPDNPSLDAVLDRFMQSDQAPTNIIDFKVKPQKKRKREKQDNEDYTNKRMKGSHLDSEHDHRLGNNNDIHGGHNDVWFWDEILEDGYTQGVLMEPISKSKDVLYDSTLNFESDRNVFDTHHGTINGERDLLGAKIGRMVKRNVP
ncbi:agamous-like MADS-box protein AGL31 [Prunus yedoensis var. nudiflora]|uniref:Agamous-like MADS-box protein AGL31 n=1 Tax=Prunus yedoensis var. nudiflora TaxID=2094558 RepID=A0A314V1A3_PRUYE|nr:agamous-like MADS-box protein AGL31 [Prunus yedoensis var. nudiflora]